MARATELFDEYQRALHKRTDRLFAGLMGFQWIAGIVFALWVSPLAWEGPVSRTHLHVWAAVVVGGIISLFPALLGLLRPGQPSTRYTIAVAQMLMGALLIHLTGGRIETHFHVFGSLAFLAFYRDWRVLVPATIVVALDHMLRGIFWPQSVYGVLVASQWRWIEHAAWVVFEDVFLVMSIRRSIVEMKQTAERTAALEQEVRTRQDAETALAERMSLSSMTATVALSLTRGTELDAMLQQCAETVVQHLGAPFAGVWTLDETEGWLELQAAAGINAGHHGQPARTPVGTFTVGSIAAARKPLVVKAEAVNPACDMDHMCREGMLVLTGYPLLVDSKLAGVIAMFTPQPLSPSATEALAAVADAIALGIDRKRAHDMQRLNAEQLRGLVDQLRLTQRQAEAATRAKSDFLASMSHELRTPLNAIILYSELLQETAEDKGQTDSIADLQRIRSAGNHLLALINGILDLSKIEAGKMSLTLEAFDVRQLLSEVVDTVAPLAQKNGNTLAVVCADAVGTMTADVMKTRQILLNLLSNASKFTHGGSIHVTVDGCLAGNRPGVRFVVTDTGIGMTLEQSAQVFQPFTQADVAITRKYGGTGLGLAIVARFCQLMGGAVWVDSRTGEGSRFTVVLPMQVDAQAEASVAEVA